MQIDNPLKLNDWDIKKFLKVVVAIQLVVLGLVGLGVIGLEIPFITQAVGFIYLTFIPGIVLLRLFKIHRLSTVETLLYSVGLSVAFLLFTGLMMNFLYPLIGISRPISTVPVIITVSAMILIMCFLSYIRDKDFSHPVPIDFKEILSPPVLLLLLLPVLSILGAQLVNFYHTSILLMALIVLIVLIVVLIAFDKFIPRKLYPLAVVAIALALLYHRSLISAYLMGPDIPIEYYLSKLVEMNSRWDSTLPSIAYNSLLSITILPVMFHHFLGMDEAWVFKIVYPLIYSLVPLGLYRAFHVQIGAKIACLSAFFFMAYHTFFTTMTFLAREQIGELFLVLLMLMMVDRKLGGVKRAALAMVFGASLIASHYTVSYFYMAGLLLAYPLLLLFVRGNRFSITGTSVMLYLVLILSWYMYTANSVTFGVLVAQGERVWNGVFTELFNQEAMNPFLLKAVGLQLPSSFWHGVGYWLYRVTVLFIVVGFIQLMLRRKERRFRPEFMAFLAVCMGWLFLSLIVPYLSAALDTSRLYHLALLFLAPLFIMGGETIFGGIRRLFHRYPLKPSTLAIRLTILIVFVPYFLFSTGFAFEVVGDYPSSIPLGMERMRNGDDTMKVLLNDFYIHEQEVASAEWLSITRDSTLPVYVNGAVSGRVLIAYGMMYGDLRELDRSSYKDDASYTYLRYLNVADGLMTEIEFNPWRTTALKYTVTIYPATEIYPLLQSRNKIYSNGGSQIYYRER